MLLVLLWASLASTADAFVMTPLHERQQQTLNSPLPRYMAGFGGASSSSSSKRKTKKNTKKNKSDSSTATATSPPLRPRKQWDLFVGDELKDADPIRVAVRGSSGKWFEIGAVKSQDNAFRDAAVIRQRPLMADHARRMFPTQIFAKDRLEFGYTTTPAESLQHDNNTSSEEDWTLVGKVEQMPESINNMIGFKGLPDPSGFYAAFSGGLQAGDSTQQTNYLNMQVKGVTGHIQSN